MVELVLKALLFTMMGVTALSAGSAAATVWLAARMWVRMIRKDAREKTPGERRLTEAAILAGLMTAISTAAVAMLAVAIYMLSFTPI